MAILGRTVALLLVVAWAGACDSRSDPERALQSYVSAVSENRCDDAQKLLSARTNYALDALSTKPQHRHSSVPIEHYYCYKLIFEDCKWKETTLSASQADTATVSMPCGRTQDSFLPGFSSLFLKYEPRSTELVREEGEWHVVVPFVIRIVEIREKEDTAIREYRERQEQFKRAQSPSSKINPK